VPVAGEYEVEEGYKLPVPGYKNMYDWNPIKLSKDTYGYFIISKLGKITVDTITYTNPLQSAPIGVGSQGKSFQGQVDTFVEVVNDGLSRTDPNYYVTTGSSPEAYNVNSPAIGFIEPEKTR
jgi:hypothetical protein